MRGRTGPRATTDPLDAGGVVEAFAGHLRSEGASVHHTTTYELPGTLSSIIDDHGHRRVVVPMALDDTWLTHLHDRMQICSDIARFATHELETFDVVITAAAVAIADTGTIVLDHRRDQGRRALTLVPPHHLCVVRTDQIVRSGPEALARLDGSLSLTHIAGPCAKPGVEPGRLDDLDRARRLSVVVLDGG